MGTRGSIESDAHIGTDDKGLSKLGMTLGRLGPVLGEGAESKIHGDAGEGASACETTGIAAGSMG